MAGKQYEVVVRFDRINRKTGAVTSYEVGDVYTGPDVEKYLTGVDHQGPLIREKTEIPAFRPSNKEI